MQQDTNPIHPQEWWALRDSGCDCQHNQDLTISFESLHGHAALQSSSWCMSQKEAMIMVSNTKVWCKTARSLLEWEGVYKKTKWDTDQPQMTTLWYKPQELGLKTEPHECNWCTQQLLRFSPDVHNDKEIVEADHVSPKPKVGCKWSPAKKMSQSCCAFDAIYLKHGRGIYDCKSNQEWNNPKEIPPKAGLSCVTSVQAWINQDYVSFL